MRRQLLVAVACVVLMCVLSGAALAQVGPWPMPPVVMEVHPNERAPGQSSNQYLGGAPWARPDNLPHNSYWWMKYKFAAGDPVQSPGAPVMLWIQVCAQNWDKAQNTFNDHDDTLLQVNAVNPTDYDGIQSGVAGSWQWSGGPESGQRVTLRFLVPSVQGAQVLWIGADESPILWWIKVTDLQEWMVYPD